MDKLTHIRSIIEAQGPLRPGVIAHILAESRATVHRWLREQVAQGVLCKTCYGFYGLPIHVKHNADFPSWLRNLLTKDCCAAFTLRQIGRAFLRETGVRHPEQLIWMELDMGVRAKDIIEVRRGYFSWAGNPFA